jgi:hypothetical protein
MNRLPGSEEAMASGLERRPPPGQAAVALLWLMMGLLVMAVQLWLLTLAFDLYRAGERAETAGVAVVSGCVFVGGLLTLGRLNRRPRVRRPGQAR